MMNRAMVKGMMMKMMILKNDNVNDDGNESDVSWNVTVEPDQLPPPPNQMINDPPVP